MPFKSEAQRREFYALASKGEMPESTLQEWSSASEGLSLPERINEKRAELHTSLRELLESKEKTSETPLKPGDIIYSEPVKADPGFGHVALYIGNNKVVGAWHGVGTRLRSLRDHVENRSNVKLLRPKATPSQVESAVSYGKKMVGTPYDIVGAVGSVTIPTPLTPGHTAKRKKLDKVFCSSLIANAYPKIPFNKGRSVTLTSPGDILTSPKVEKLSTDEILSKLQESGREKIAGVMDVLPHVAPWLIAGKAVGGNLLFHYGRNLPAVKKLVGEVAGAGARAGMAGRPMLSTPTQVVLRGVGFGPELDIVSAAHTLGKQYGAALPGYQQAAKSMFNAGTAQKVKNVPILGSSIEGLETMSNMPLQSTGWRKAIDYGLMTPGEAFRNLSVKVAKPASNIEILPKSAPVPSVPVNPDIAKGH